MKISTKISFFILIALIFPNMITVTLLDINNVSDAFYFLGCYTILLIILIIPTSKLIAYFLVNNDIAKINELFKCVKQGNYCSHFSLPHEKENESEITVLKRNINWMMHAVSTREDTLHSKIEKEKSSKNKFKEQSYVDSLTQVYNRRYFDETISTTHNYAIVNNYNIALIMIDCDHFKEINDTYGHQVGDSILTLLGTILKDTVKLAEDCPFRYGGDEFGIIITNTPSTRLIEISNELSKKFCEGNKYGATLSIGVANCHSTFTNNINSERLKKLADQALYESKESGRNTVSFKEI